MKEYEKNQSNNELQKIKENNELRSVEVGIVTKLIKDEVEILSDIEVYTDYDNNSENHRVIGFRYNFHSSKGPMTIDDKDVKKVLTYKEFLYTKILKNGKKKIFKYFIGYKNDEKLDQLPQMS